MKRIALFILCLTLLTVLGGCGTGKDTESSPASVVVGFSQLGAESSWRMANTRSVEEAAKKYGFGLMMENANQKQEKQIDAIRSFIAYQVDVIAFSPIVETGWDNVLGEARQAGIFEMKNLPAEALQHLANVNCPAIVYPYLRANLADIITRTGLPPVHMPEVSFEGLYQQRLAQANEQASEQAKAGQA